MSNLGDDADDSDSLMDILNELESNEKEWKRIWEWKKKWGVTKHAVV